MLMMRWFLSTALIATGLYAEGIPEEKLASIYTEALWFVAVIAVMSLISFVVSSRNARKYEAEQQVENMRKEKVILDTQTQTKADTSLKQRDIVQEVDQLIALSVMVEKGLLTEMEFQVFKKRLLEE